MINMDMVGRLRGDKLDVHGMGTSPVWKVVVEEANRAARLQLNLKEGGYGPSDHSPFYAAGKPVFFAFTGVHADYHKPSDTAERVDVAGIARVLALVEPVTAAIATAPEPIAFTRVAADKENAGSAVRGFRVWVGGVPDYSREGPGVGFSGVSPLHARVPGQGEGRSRRRVRAAGELTIALPEYGDSPGFWTEAPAHPVRHRANRSSQLTSCGYGWSSGALTRNT